MLLLAYFAVALVALFGLAAMILAIARSLADCPEKGLRAKAAGITIATGFVAIGGGAVLLIGSLATLGEEVSLQVFAMGLACLILGLGFTQAVTTLRSVIDGPAARRTPTLKSDPPPMEPVLG